MDKRNVIVGIGTGWPRGEAEKCNAISARIAEVVNVLANEKRDQIFLVGGNGIIAGDGIEGLPEAFRMKKVITITEALFTDCDERSGFKPSHNTPTNAYNIVQHIQKESMTSCDIVAARQHLPRVIGCIRKELFKTGLINSVEMTGYPIDAEFEANNGQTQLSSEAEFRNWTLKANMHHLLFGLVRRHEYIQMLRGRIPPQISINPRFLPH